MALTQGDPLPSITTTQATTTQAPDWYNNFLSGLSTAGQQAVDTGGIAGFSPLQEQAFGNAPAAVQAGQPALQAATQAATNVATTPFMQNVSQYMNPYTQSVIEDINRRGQRQFRETLAPGVTAGAVGSGQFGSKRGMEVYGNVARDVNQDILGTQAKYLAQGFDQATAAAKAQAELELAASGRLGELSGRAYEQGIGGLDVLSKLGAQMQAQEQAKLDYPMSALGKYANVMRGFTVPTSTTQTRTGPMTADYYQSAPLNQILQYITTLAALNSPTNVPAGQTATGPTPINSLITGLTGLLRGSGATGTTQQPTGSPSAFEVNDFINSMNNYLGSGQTFNDWFATQTPESLGNIDWGV
jgi:hypothetical protein